MVTQRELQRLQRPSRLRTSRKRTASTSVTNNVSSTPQPVNGVMEKIRRLEAERKKVMDIVADPNDTPKVNRALLNFRSNRTEQLDVLISKARRELLAEQRAAQFGTSKAQELVRIKKKDARKEIQSLKGEKKKAFDEQRKVIRAEALLNPLNQPSARRISKMTDEQKIARDKALGKATATVAVFDSIRRGMYKETDVNVISRKTQAAMQREQLKTLASEKAKQIDLIRETRPVGKVYNRLKTDGYYAQPQPLVVGVVQPVKEEKNNDEFVPLPSGGTAKIENEEQKKFYDRVLGTYQREEQFFSAIDPEKSKAARRVKGYARAFTGGYMDFSMGYPYVKYVDPTQPRSTATGRIAENILYGGMLWPTMLVGGVLSAGEKIAASYDASMLGIDPQAQQEEKKESFKKLERTSFSFLPGGTKINEAGAETLATAAFFGLAGLSGAKTSWPVRTAMKTLYRGRYVTPEATGITFVEDYTVPTKIGELRSLEGQKVKQVHVTTAELPTEFITEARPESAGKFRQKQELFGFYKSSPESVKVTNVKGHSRALVTDIGQKPVSRTSSSIISPFEHGRLIDVAPSVRYTSQGRAYLAYAGIGGVESGAKGIIYGNPTIRALVFTEKVTPTPKNLRGIQEINWWQQQQSGKTFVPAENIALASVEGQLISPSAYAKYPEWTGSKITLSTKPKFTYYQSKAGKYYKIDLFEAKTRPVDTAKATLSKASPKIIDVAKYSESYYAPKRISSTPKVVSPLSISSRKSSSNRKVSSSAKSISSGFVSSGSASSATSSMIGSSVASSGVSSGSSSTTSTSSFGSSTTSSSGSSTGSSWFSRGSSSRTTSSRTSRSSRYSRPRTSRTPPSITERRSDTSKKRMEPSPNKKIAEFLVEIKRKGTYESFMKGLTRKQALAVGIRETSRSLAASFRIKATGKSLVQKKKIGVEYLKLLETQYRGYKIRKGQRQPLKDEFIQRRNKRLSSLSERKKIQRARQRSNFIKRSSGRSQKFF